MARLFVCILLLVALFATAQQPAPKELGKSELAQLVPTNYFFAGLTATTQARNAGGVRFSDGKLLLVSLVDTSGYSSGTAQKYQGLLITEVPLQIGGKTVPPGSYGFGLPTPDHMGVLDINANEIAGEPTADTETAQRPVPLRLSAASDGVTVSLGKRRFKLQRGNNP